MNSNIISLPEDGKIPNQYGDVSQRNWFTNATISQSLDTVFIFGGNVGHIQNRALGGGGQAAATAKQQNVIPIITTGNYTDSTQVQKYHQKIKNILQEYVQNGGKVVFPTKLATQADVDLLNREGYNVNIGDEIVNVGTGLAAGNYIAGTRAFAQHLFKELKKIPVQSVGKYGSCINYFHQQMNKLEVGFQKPTYKAEYLQQNQQKRPDDKIKRPDDKFTKIFNTLLAKNKFQRLTVEKMIKVFKDAEKWGSYTGYLKKYSYKRMKELFSNAKLKGMHRKEFTHEVRQIKNEYSTPEQRAFSVAFSKIKDNNGNNLSTSSFFQNFEGNTKKEKTHNMIKFIKNAVQNLRR